jgi:signal transduction histidine kinase
LLKKNNIVAHFILVITFAKKIDLLMKIKFIWFVFFGAIASLLIFQAIGVYYAYSLKKEDFEKQVSALFPESVEKEVMFRFERSNIQTSGVNAQHLTAEEKATFVRGVKVYEFDQKELQEAGFYQQPAHIHGAHSKSKLKDDFFNAFTHNTITPLGTIKSVLSGFISGELTGDSEKKEEFGKIAMAQVDNLHLLTERILTIAKLEGRRQTINRSDTNMYAMISELKEMYAVVKNKQVVIKTSVTVDNEKIIYIDKVLIKEAVSNLIDNAVKYSGNSVKISLACYTTTDTLCIQVKDNGYGISAQDRQKIFKKFERAAAVDRKEVRGFGLGLSYVKYVTELHGGTVLLTSQEGKGSEFTLSLPLPESIS